jgi:anthranilate synthase component 2/para-aminobenzoate synthetase component 2
MILIIDNYDSFVHTIARYFREAGAEVRLARNDAISASEAIALSPNGLVLSPGPKGPAEAGVCLELIRLCPARLPLLGVCLGHQCLVAALGGEVRRSIEPMHGRSSSIRHSCEGLFQGVPNPAAVGRYHSLIATLAEHSPLQATAWSERGEVMAVRHVASPWFGVQFHPESLLTPYGRLMIENFLRTTR